MNLFVCYDRCGTCKKAEAFLKEHNIPYEKRPIKEQNPSAEELRAWWQMSALPLRKFFNTSGLLYKDLQLKDKLPGMSEKEMLALLSTDGMLVKRPLLVQEGKVLVGFLPEEWEKTFLG